MRVSLKRLKAFLIALLIFSTFPQTNARTRLTAREDSAQRAQEPLEDRQALGTLHRFRILEREFFRDPELSANHDKLIIELWDNRLVLIPEWQHFLHVIERDVVKHPGSPKAWFRLGRITVRGKERDRARQCFERAIELDRDYAAAYCGLGEYYLRPSWCGLGKTDDDDLEKAVELFQHSVQLYSDYADGYAGLGDAYEGLSKYNDAVDAYEQATRLDPERERWLLRLGELRVKLGRLDEALVAFDRVAEQNAALLATESKQFRRSNIYFFYLSSHRLGEIQRRLGQFAEALVTYNRVVQFGLDSSHTHFGLGLTYADLGDRDSAWLQHRKLLELANLKSDETWRTIIKEEATQLSERIASIP